MVFPSGEMAGYRSQPGPSDVPVGAWAAAAEETSARAQSAGRARNRIGRAGGEAGDGASGERDARSAVGTTEGTTGGPASGTAHSTYSHGTRAALTRARGSARPSAPRRRRPRRAAR